MSFTRFYDDPFKVQMRTENSSFQGRYMLNTPGQGMDLPFQEDPQLRLQKWGANLQTNTVNLESDLFGLTRPLNRDNMMVNSHVQAAVSSSPMQFGNKSPFVDESRATHPAWMYKDLEQTRWEHPLLNPLHDIELKFNNNIQTRILEKDYYDKRVASLGRT
jgi:hypothetical protein